MLLTMTTFGLVRPVVPTVEVVLLRAAMSACRLMAALLWATVTGARGLCLVLSRVPVILVVRLVLLSIMMAMWLWVVVA